MGVAPVYTVSKGRAKRAVLAISPRARQRNATKHRTRLRHLSKVKSPLAKYENGTPEQER